MKPTPVSDVAEWLGGAPVGFDPAAMVSTFALDSNSVNPGDLFFAIKGARVDGHDFVPQAIAAGAVGSLAERPVDGPHILVENLVHALAKLATHFRSEFEGPVVGVTGSAGKTTTKEFVASALSPLGPVLKTQGNRNSEYTSPLVWTDLEPTHKSAVIEMAMRGFHQIAHLASFSKPSVGLVTNIGYAHLEMVESRYGITLAKGELLDSLPSYGSSVLWYEDDMLEWLRIWATGEVITFGFEDGADCRITDYHAESWQSAVVAGRCNGQNWEAKMPAAGRHMALNVASAILTAAVLGVAPEDAAAQIERTKLPPMRMETFDRGGKTILLDTYNASPPSMIAAIDTLADLTVKGKRFAVIGEMKELGQYTDAAHRSVGEKLAEAEFDRLLFYGPATEVAIKGARDNGMPESRIRRATSIEDVEKFIDELQAGDTVLIKGSRALELERAVTREAHS